MAYIKHLLYGVVVAIIGFALGLGPREFLLYSKEAISQFNRSAADSLPREGESFVQLQQRLQSESIPEILLQLRRYQEQYSQNCYQAQLDIWQMQLYYQTRAKRKAHQLLLLRQKEYLYSTEYHFLLIHWAEYLYQHESPAAAIAFAQRLLPYVKKNTSYPKFLYTLACWQYKQGAKQQALQHVNELIANHPHTKEGIRAKKLVVSIENNS